MEINILKLKPKQVATVAGFSNNQIAGKLLAMGVLPGSTIQVVRTTPLKSAYYLKVDGRNLAVRKEEAACILIK